MVWEKKMDFVDKIKNKVSHYFIEKAIERQLNKVSLYFSLLPFTSTWGCTGFDGDQEVR